MQPGESKMLLTVFIIAQFTKPPPPSSPTPTALPLLSCANLLALAVSVNTYIYRYMIFFGMRPKKYAQWLEVLREEGRSLTWRDWLAMLWLGISGRRVARQEWRRRLRVCRVCPIYDPPLRRCRKLHDGRALGCGCWVPLIAWFKPKCWADETAPQEHVGWMG